MADFWVNGIGGIIISTLAFLVGISFKKDHPAIARLFIVFAFCWVVAPILFTEPTYIHKGCIITGIKTDELAWAKSLLIHSIIISSIITFFKHHKHIFIDKKIDVKANTEDYFDDGL